MSGVGSILVIDDEPVLQDVLKTLLESNGFGYYPAATAAAGMQILREEDVDVVLLDLMLPDLNGLELLPQFKAYDPHLPVIVITAYSSIESAIAAMKTVMYAGGGRIADRLGTRMGYTLMMIWWSLSCAAQGLINGFRGLAVFRFSLGLGEGGSFPHSAKAVSEWFPAKERSTAVGMFNTGSAVGSVIAPPLLALIVVLLGWRWVFFISGSIGILWAAAWIFRYHPPSSHPRISAAEADLIRKSREEEGRGSAAEDGSRVKWSKLFTHREVLCLLLAKFLTDPVWFFYVFWLPKYLYDSRGFDIRQIGYYAWIPQGR